MRTRQAPPRTAQRLAALCTVCLFALSLRSTSAQLLGLSEPDEIELGRRIAAEVEFDQPMVNDRTVLDFVERLGLRLARASDRNHLRYRFRILDTDDVNAFALPGGFIYITRGLLEGADSEDEVAGVLGHEIGHVVGRHHASRIRRSQLISLGFSALGPILGSGVRGAATRLGGRVGVQGLFQRFSREQEREADRLGAKNVHDVGHDPRGMVTFFERLAASREARPGRVQRFFASHPSPGERAENITDLIESLPPRQRSAAASPVTFRRVRARLEEIRPVVAESSSAAVSALLESGDSDPESPDDRRREVAALFAPLFYQALGSEPRYDYVTNFDFDDDWRGDNNWENAAEKRWPLRAFIYYHVQETATHFFIHYAAFHPRDYKGGSGRGRWFSRAIRAGVSRVGTNDPTGRARELVLAHENDLEGCLVAVEKHGADPADGRVQFVETLAHNEFLRYVPGEPSLADVGRALLSGQHVKLFIEPKGHGIEAYRGDDAQLGAAEKGFRLYAFTGVAEEQPGNEGGSDTVGYELVPLSTTLWPLARQGVTPTYAETTDYGTMLLNTLEPDGNTKEYLVRLGHVGSAFRGTVGGENLARPPWGWFDGKNRNEPLGQWYFDPARTIRDHFGLGPSFSVAYTVLDPSVAPESTP